jgi:hypothetical protein
VWEIRGEVRNAGTARQPVPPLEVRLVDSAGATLARWTVAPPAGSLAPGAVLAFETSAINPPAGAARVAVRLKPAALARL